MPSNESRSRARNMRRAEIGLEKRKRTRVELIAAAFRVFADKGFEAPVIDDFIIASGLSRGTFYNYFKTREEILKAVADELAREINARILPVLKPLTDPAERICASLLCFIGIAAADQTRGWILVRMIPVVGGPLNDHMRRHARNEIKKGVDRGRFQIDSIPAALDLGLGMAAMVIRSILAKHVPADYSRTAVAMFMRSLGIDAKEARRVAAMPLPLLHSYTSAKQR
ncbi:MAG TPA: TetR/AcrR family transcriptional regulator [Steroidobacteraceae bacterium]